MASDRDSSWTIRSVTPADFDVLLPLARAYCDFYEVAPSDADLQALFAALCADARNEGVQLLAWDDAGHAVGFATVYWSWSTAHAARIGVLNDLFVTPQARGRGAAEALIAASVEQCRRRGARQLGWQTALDNHRAQRVYDRVGATREQWVDYSIAVPRVSDWA